MLPIYSERPLIKISVLLHTFLALGITHTAHANDLFVADMALPEVLTATHLYQPPAAVPGSVSTIDQELIISSGARNLTDLLRLVPGMLVAPDSGNLTSVNYHGTNLNQARRLQVLIDGRSVYRAAFAQVSWSDLPVAIEDIQRIEVFRGPNTVSYGANALLGVINIITTPAKDVHGTLIKGALGQNGIRDGYARQAWHSDRSDMRLSLSSLTDNGFDKRRDGSNFRDGRRLSRFNLRTNHQLDEHNTIDWQLAFKEGSNQVNNNYQSFFAKNLQPKPNEQDTDSDVQAKDYAASLRWTNTFNTQHNISLQANAQQWERLREWRACDAQRAFSSELKELWQISTPAQLSGLISGEIDPKTLSPRQLGLLKATLPAKGEIIPHSCGLITENSRESRVDLELQDTYSISDSLRLISGLSYRYDQARSKTFLNGLQRKDITRAFSQVEWYATEHWLLQGGGMFEHDSSNGDSFSPRLAVNYLFTPAHGLRAVYSEAVRSPDMFENHADWRYRVRDLRPALSSGSNADFAITAKGSGELKQEKIEAYELGYNGYFAAQRVSVDIKLFEEKISRMISGSPKVHLFNLSNNDHIKFYGSEFESNWQASDKDRLRLSYAYIRDRASNPIDQTSPKHSGSLAWLRDWNQGWNSSLMYFAAKQLNGHDLQLATARIAKHLNWADKRLTVAGNLQKTLNNHPIGHTSHKDNSQDLAYLSLQLEF